MAQLTNLIPTTNTPIELPIGDFANRVSTTVGGLRYNSDARSIEHLDNTGWIQLNPTGKQVFSFTGANQTLTIPAGVTAILAKCWGAGGGAGTIGGWYIGSPGGGGGFMSSVITVTPGENLIVIVGERGRVNPSTYAFGGGGRATNNNVDNRYGGGGGGYSGIFRTSVSQANALIIAGGGGGGGSSRTTAVATAPQADSRFVNSPSGVNNGGPANYGGAGGGLFGRGGVSAFDNKPNYGGNPGRIDVGAGANALSDSANGGGEQTALLGGSPRTNSYGGGGGGGFWGGSAGGYSESRTMAGGGGGCGFFAVGTIPVVASTGFHISPGSQGLVDIDYVNPIGLGGIMDTGAGAAPPQGQEGGHGRVVVYFYK
jgi:hypothetical protein